MANKTSYSRSLANRHQVLFSKLRDELDKKQEHEERLERQHQEVASKESLVSNQEQYHDETNIGKHTKYIPTAPPTQLHDFYEYIRTISLEDLYQLPKFIAPGSEELTPGSSLLEHARIFKDWQMQYYNILGAFYDFAGRCSFHFCPDVEAGSGKHIHGIQAAVASEIKGLPGVLVFSVLYSPLFPELLDSVMDLREREPSVDSDDSLGAGSDGFNGKDVVLPSDVSKLIQQSFPNFFNIDDYKVAKLYLSTPEQQLGLRRPPAEHGTVAHLSFGCDSVFVIGNAEAVEVHEEIAHKHNAVDDDSWRELVDFGEEQNSQPNNKSPTTDSKFSNEKGCPEKPSPPKTNAVAIRLRAGDLLLFDSRAAASSTWYGIAKVFEGTSLNPEQQWPHLQPEGQDSGNNSMRGQLSGKAVELEIRSFAPNESTMTG